MKKYVCFLFDTRSYKSVYTKRETLELKNNVNPVSCDLNT